MPWLGRAIAVIALIPGCAGTGLARDYGTLQRFGWNFAMPALRLLVAKVHSPLESEDARPGWRRIARRTESPVVISKVPVKSHTRRIRWTKSSSMNCGTAAFAWLRKSVDCYALRLDDCMWRTTATPRKIIDIASNSRTPNGSR